MGAFFIYRKDTELDLNTVQTFFRDKGLGTPLIRNLGNYNLWLYKKTLVEDDNFLETDSSSLFVVGTIIYKRNDYRGSLRQILVDIQNKTLDFNELIGSFALFLAHDHKVLFLTDMAGIQNIFYLEDKSVISSSFLATLFASKRPLHINLFAVSEILVTGNLIGPDTAIKGIKRFLIRAPETFEGLQLLTLPEHKIPDDCSENYKECLDEQISILKDYFLSIKTFAEKYGVSLGLTAGLDSRLLLILIKKYIRNIQFFSTWREHKDRDFSIAEKVAAAVGHELVTIPVTASLEMNSDQAHDTLHQAFLFFDGLVRTHHFWTEKINTKAYREKLLNRKRISISGIGGEQYRNQERMIRPAWSFKKWIEYELIYRYAGDCFRNKKDKNIFLEYLGEKIRQRLGIQGNGKISHLDIKRYYNEIYNPANRTLRMNIENQIAFFLCPYTEYRIARSAYKIIPHLGAHLKFEADLIRKLSSRIAAIETHYGINLIRGEPLKIKAAAHVKELLPFQVFYKLYQRRKPVSNFYSAYLKRFEFARNLALMIEKLDLPVKIDRLSRNSLLNPLLIAMGYFLLRTQKKISL